MAQRNHVIRCLAMLSLALLFASGCESGNGPVAPPDPELSNSELPTFQVFDLGGSPRRFRVLNSVPSGYRGSRVVRFYDAEGALTAEHTVGSFREMVSQEVIRKAHRLLADPEFAVTIDQARQLVADLKRRRDGLTGDVK